MFSIWYKFIYDFIFIFFSVFQPIQIRYIYLILLQLDTMVILLLIFFLKESSCEKFIVPEIDTWNVLKKRIFFQS